MNIMKDFLNQELSIGDLVILIVPRYRSLVKGTVIAFTPNNIRVEYNNTWNYGEKGLIKQILQCPSQVVKLN